MELQGDQVALYLSGQDIPVMDCNIIVHQPTIKEIVLFKETSFLNVVQLFTNVEDNAAKIRESNSVSQDYSDFQLLMALLNQPTGELKENLETFFQLVFPTYTVEIRESDISFYIDERRVGMINSYNYKTFCEVIDDVFGLPTNKKKYNPANSKAAEIAKKFKQREEELAKRKGQNTESAPSLFASYVSILSVGMQLDINII